MTIIDFSDLFDGISPYSFLHALAIFIDGKCDPFFCHSIIRFVRLLLFVEYLDVILTEYQLQHLVLLILLQLDLKDGFHRL